MNINQMLKLAKDMHNGGKLDEAAEKYAKIIALNPKEINAVFRLGVLYFQQNKFAQAFNQFRQAHELAPREFEPAYQCSLAAFRMGILELCYQYSGTAHQLNPTHVDCLGIRAKSCVAMDDVDTGEELYEKLFKHLGYNDFYQRGIEELALQMCRVSAIIKGEDPERAKRLIDKSVSYLSQLIEQKNPKYAPQSTVNAANIEKARGNTSEAMELYSKASGSEKLLARARWEISSLNIKSKKQQTASGKKLLVHIGAMKCASTWLQARVFPYLPETYNLGFNFYELLKNNGDYAVHYGAPCFASSADFDLSSPEQSAAAIYKSISNSDRAILSVESLASNLDSTIPLLQSLRKKGVDISVLFICRNHKDFVWSLYSQNFRAKTYTTERLKDVLNMGEPQANMLNIQNFSFTEKYNRLTEVLGSDKVTLAPLEKLFGSNEMLTSVCRALELDLTADEMSHLMSGEKINESIAQIKEHTKMLNPDREQLLMQIFEHFREDNRKLSEVSGLNLSDLGYFD